MDDFWKLKVISLICSCLPLLFIFLIPSKTQIEALQKRMAKEDEIEQEEFEAAKRAAEGKKDDEEEDAIYSEGAPSSSLQ